MVGAYELTIDAASCGGVYYVAEHLAIAIDGVSFAREVLVFGMYVEGVRLSLRGTEFAAQVFVVDVEAQLVGDVCVVAYTIVDVIV